MARNWNSDVTLSYETGHQLYATVDLIDKFTELLENGYEGLSLGLIIDLIDGQVPQVTVDDVFCRTCGALGHYDTMTPVSAGEYECANCETEQTK